MILRRIDCSFRVNNLIKKKASAIIIVKGILYVMCGVYFAKMIRALKIYKNM